MRRRWWRRFVDIEPCASADNAAGNNYPDADACADTGASPDRTDAGPCTDANPGTDAGPCTDTGPCTNARPCTNADAEPYAGCGLATACRLRSRGTSDDRRYGTRWPEMV